MRRLVGWWRLAQRESRHGSHTVADRENAVGLSDPRDPASDGVPTDAGGDGWPAEAPSAREKAGEVSRRGMLFALFAQEAGARADGRLYPLGIVLAWLPDDVLQQRDSGRGMRVTNPNPNPNPAVCNGTLTLPLPLGLSP